MPTVLWFRGGKYCLLLKMSKKKCEWLDFQSKSCLPLKVFINVEGKDRLSENGSLEKSVVQFIITWQFLQTFPMWKVVLDLSTDLFYYIMSFLNIILPSTLMVPLTP